MVTVDDIRYDPATHTSAAPDGRPVPHVTAVLAAVGLTTDFERVAASGGRAAQAVDMARLRGSAVHQDCHAFDDEDLDWDTVHPAVRPYVMAWAEVRRAKGLVPVAHGRERRLFHSWLWYTGIVDGIFHAGGPGGPRVLLDIKTGDPDDAACHLQTAAYEGAWMVAHPDQPIAERWAVRLQPLARVPYRITNYSARLGAAADYAKWQAALCVYSEQPGRRRLFV